MEYIIVIKSKPKGFRVSKMLRTLLDRSYGSKEFAMLVIDMAYMITAGKPVVFGIVSQTAIEF